MSDKATLKLDFCSYEAAKYARALRHEKPAHLTTKQAALILDKNFSIVMGSSKYRYLYPIDDAMRKQIEPLRKPYPKRGAGETDNAPDTNQETGGASPTAPLYDS